MKNQTNFRIWVTMYIAFLLFSNCSTNKLEQKRLLARLTATEDRINF